MGRALVGRAAIPGLRSDSATTVRRANARAGSNDRDSRKRHAIGDHIAITSLWHRSCYDIDMPTTAVVSRCAACSSPTKRITSLIVALVVVRAPFALGGDLWIGPTVGGSLLEQGPDTSFSHGPLYDEVLLGRTLLFGLVTGIRLGNQDEVDFEIAIGPYHGDLERYCIQSFTPAGPTCKLEPFVSVSHGLLYGVQYVYRGGFRGQKGSPSSNKAVWKPLLGAGLGFKTYSYEQSPMKIGHTSLTLTGSIGVERAGPFPVRLEVRGMFVRQSPILYSNLNGDHGSQFELQVRIGVSVIKRP
jgi:hypothetical protein